MTTTTETTNAGKRALSYRVAKQLQKKHVNTRIQGLVKTVIIRKCKFITSEADPAKFVRLYKTCVLGSLNNCVKALLNAKNMRRAKLTPHLILLTCSASFVANLKPLLKKKRRSSGSQIHCWNMCVGKQRWVLRRSIDQEYQMPSMTTPTRASSPSLMRHLRYYCTRTTLTNGLQGTTTCLLQAYREVRRLWENTRGAASDTLNMAVGVRKG